MFSYLYNYTSILIAFFIFTPTVLKAQNTVGTITNTENSFNGYTLFTSEKETYLINNCGEVINQWSSDYPPGNAVYLLEDGSLLRACKIENNSIVFGGTGGRIEKFNWEGDLIWSYNYSDSNKVQHHDIYPLPNGNILVLAATVISSTEAIEAGRDPSKLTNERLFNEQIIEIEPAGLNNANIIWEWNIKDHLIQEFDATKNNYGIVSENPQLLDINYLGGLSGNENWLHVNSIQYNEDLDQIVLSSRHMNEIYIIDHSTTTSQAASNTGGLYGKGGDFLYRWGNPEAYNQGTQDDRKLFGQHYPHWIPEGLPNAGRLIMFNNGFGRSPSYSEVFITTPPTDSEGVYTYTPNTAYGPDFVNYTYTDPNNQTNFFSRILSSAQMLPNGNILICDGDSGYFFEIDNNENIVWEYINPVHTLGIMSQGDNPDDFPNIVFRAIKYAQDYPAFIGKDLTPTNPIELNADISNCSLLSTEDLAANNLKIYPNPTQGIIYFKNGNTPINRIEIYNLLGAQVKNIQNSNTINLSNIESGVYLAKIYSNKKTITKKIIKQ